MKKISFCNECKAFRGKEQKCHQCGKKTVKTDLPIKRGSYYYIPGQEEPFASVTSILRAIDKPALRGWIAKQAAIKALENPYLSVEEATAAVYERKGESTERGKEVHIAIEDIMKGNGKKSHAKNIKSYIKAYQKFAKAVSHKLIASEKMVYSKKYHYAGTLDCILKLRNGDLVIVDFKTGKYIYPESGLQLAAYYQALREMYPSKRPPTAMMVLLLKDNGTYVWQEKNEPLEVFLATKKLWEWLETSNNNESK